MSIDKDSPLEKVAFDGSFSYIARGIKDIIKFPFKHPTMTAVGAAGVAGTYYGMHRQKKKDEFKQLAKRYQKVGK